MPPRQTYRWEVDIPLPRAVVWRFASDTQRFNRIAGLPPVRYSYQALASGGSEVRGETRMKGMRMRWIERPAVWVEPEFFRFTRDYSAGPFKQLISEVRLREDSADSTHLTHTTEVEPNGTWGAIVTRMGVPGTGKRFLRAYALAPAWAAAQRLLPDPDRAASEATGRLQQQLARIGKPIAERLDGEAVLERLTTLLTTQPAEELASLAPYALADQWQLPRDKVLRFFLHAAKGGALDVRYSLICPSCRRSKKVFASLDEVTTVGHCETCNIDFGVDFDRAVEVRFSPAPLGLDATPIEYCQSGPQNTPHRVAHFSLAAGAEQSAEVLIAPGRHQLASPQCKGAVFCDVVEDDTLPAQADVTLTEAGVAGVPERLRAGTLALRLESGLAVEATLAVVRTRWADDAVSAAEITSLQEFRDLFGSQILAPGAEFAVQNMVFLFSDLVGSTAMYERIGDASAFALVRDHFDVMREIYTEHGGSLVKTIGDAVMAVFRRADDALRAALQMHQRVSTLRDKVNGEPLSLRIGLHRGACIAMEANGLVDYFGTTVNLAARVQGRAGAGETALSPALLEEPAVRELIAASELVVSEQSAQLKGLSGDHVLTVLRSR